MSKYLVIALLLLGLNSKGQTDFTLLYSEVEELFDTGHYQEALGESEKLQLQIKNEIGEANENYFNASLLKADCLYAIKNYTEAVTAYVYAAEVANKYEGKQFNYAYASHSLSQAYKKTGNLDKTEDALLSAGQAYEQSIGTENEFYLYLLEELIEFYSSTADKASLYSIYSIYAPLEERVAGYPPHSEVGNSFYELAELALYFGDYGIAANSAEKALYVFEEFQLEKKDKILSSVFLLGKAYYHTGDYYLVNPLLDEVELMLVEQANSTIDKTEITYYKGLANYELNNYKSAIFNLEKIKDKLDDFELVIAYYTLGKAQSASGLKTEALVSMNYVLKTFLAQTEYSKGLHAELLNEIALLEQTLADYDNAIVHFEKTLELIGNEDLDMKLKVMANLAALHSDLGQFTQAEDTYLIVLEVVEKQPNKTGLYLTILNNLGMLYMDWGEYSKCELLLNECLALSKKHFGKQSIEHANARNNLGSFYFEVGNYNESVDHFIGALNAYEYLQKENSIDYSSILNNIGMLFLEVEDYEGAQVFLDSARALELRIIGDNHPDYATTLNNLSEVYSKLGAYEKASDFLKQAMKIVKGHFTDTHPDFALYQMNLGILQSEAGKLDEAQKTLSSALYLHQTIYGAKHPNYAIAQFHFANLLAKQNKIAQAIPLFNSSIETFQNHLSNFLPFLSEKEKSGFYDQYVKYFHSYFSFAVLAKEIDPSIQDRVFDLSLTLKGLLLRSSKAMRNMVLNSGDEELIHVYDAWVNIKKRISEISALPVEQRSKNLDKLISEANGYEKRLYQLSDELGSTNLKKANWLNIKESLKEKEAVVEFVSYKKEGTENMQYGALILRNDSKHPEFVELFEEDELLKIIDLYGANDFDYISKIYHYSKEGENQLYGLIWQPIESALGDANRVYVSSTGLLHRVSLYAIASGENKYLIDAYELISLNSTSDILNYNEIPSSDMQDIALMGGINYDTEKSDKEVWQYLPGSKDEVLAINEYLEKRKKNVTLKTFDEATETYFKEISEKSDILHIATHGFFFPDPQKIWNMFEEVDEKTSEDIDFRGNSNVVGVSSFTANKDPLMRSGLVFAGVHDLWSGQYVTKRDDGILTALEVSQLNLSGTKLAVLSACETGLGEIIGDEGVYGLKRTFKVAGVKNLIISLWQVPDKETMEFMLLFYENLYSNEQMTIYQAFELAQREMSKKYEPYFWAAFVLVK